ncbi:MAG: hypothetical protein ACI8RZ_006772 [Myxococcota bacterium]|jgi:hypothetical protein
MLASLLLLSSCDTDLLTDSSFDVWCGDTLCSWEVEAGSIAKVPTWHSADYGVSMVGEEVILSQRLTVTQEELDCIEFRLTADIGEDATISLQLDFLDDGIDEYSHPLTSDNFEESSYFITPPSWFDSVRFTLHKQGSGEAILGQIRALSEGPADCLADPLILSERPDGAPCDAADECSGGTCAEVTLPSSSGTYTLSTCSSCETDADCAGVCGLSASEPELQSFLTCETDQGALLGEYCATDAECDSSFCTDSQCSECATTADCDGENTCTERIPLAHHQCLGEPRPAGAPCLYSTDCSSGTCDGEQIQRACNTDGRVCTSSDDCPWEELGAECVSTGLQDGTCQ